MRSSTSFAFVTLTLLLGGAVVSSHHSTAVVYDETQTITVVGVVADFKFVNPHAMLSMDVTDAGKVVKWTVEFAGRLNLSEVGWTEKSIAPTERVTVTGNPTRDKSPRMLFRRLVKADGTELLPAAPQREREVEELRRQRARQRQK